MLSLLKSVWVVINVFRKHEHVRLLTEDLCPGIQCCFVPCLLRPEDLSSVWLVKGLDEVG